MVPAEVKGRVSFDQSLFGDFKVCPLTEQRPGMMQFVCVESAEHLVARPNQ